VIQNQSTKALNLKKNFEVSFEGTTGRRLKTYVMRDMKKKHGVVTTTFEAPVILTTTFETRMDA